MCAQRTYYGAFVLYCSNATELQSTCSSCLEQLHAKSNPLNTQVNNNYFNLCTVHFFTMCIMNKQMHTRLTVFIILFFIYSSTCFNANASSSGSSHSVPAKLHKRVHAIMVAFFPIRFLESLKHYCLSYNKLYCHNNSVYRAVISDFSTQIVYTAI